MKFCSNCGNLLSPMENDEGKLIGKCNQGCGNEENYDDKIIKKTVYKMTGNSDIVNQENLIYDSTLPRTQHIECPNEECASKKDKKLQEAVFYQNDNTLKVNYICTVCTSTWKYS